MPHESTVDHESQYCEELESPMANRDSKHKVGTFVSVFNLQYVHCGLAYYKNIHYVLQSQLWTDHYFVMMMVVTERVPSIWMILVITGYKDD